MEIMSCKVSVFNYDRMCSFGNSKVNSYLFSANDFMFLYRE